MVVLRMIIVVPLIPYFFDIVHALRFTLIHFRNQSRIKGFIEPHTFRFNLQGFIEKVVFTGDDIDKVSDAARRMICAVEVDMNSAGAVCKPARFTEQPNQFLQRFYIVLVVKNRADHFHTEFSSCGNYL